MTHPLLTMDEARAIKAKFGLSYDSVKLAADVMAANAYANKPMVPATPPSDTYRCDYANSYRTGLRDPAETLAYWYAQEAQERAADDKAAAFNAARIF